MRSPTCPAPIIESKLFTSEQIEALAFDHSVKTYDGAKHPASVATVVVLSQTNTDWCRVAELTGAGIKLAFNCPSGTLTPGGPLSVKERQSAVQMRKAIDAANERASQMCHRADQLEAQAKELVMQADAEQDAAKAAGFRWQAKSLLEDVHKMRGKVDRLLTVRLPRLGHTLANFQTEPMPFVGASRGCGSDHGVIYATK